MNVQMEFITVMAMQPVITLMDPSPVLAKKALVEVVKSVMVRNGK